MSESPGLPDTGGNTNNSAESGGLWDDLIQMLMLEYAAIACEVMFSMCGNPGQQSYVPRYDPAVEQHALDAADLAVGEETEPEDLDDMCEPIAPDEYAWDGSDQIVRTAAMIIAQGNMSPAVQSLKALRDLT